MTTPLCALALQRLFNEAGFDHGEFHSVFIDKYQVRSLIESRFSRGFKFIGHASTGKILAEMCGENMKKATFELGGNNPFIVLNDAKIDNAVEAAYKSRMHCNA